MPDTARRPGAWANAGARVMSQHARMHPGQGRLPETVAPYRGPGARYCAHGRRGRLLHRRAHPVSAVTRALQAVALGLLEDHLGACVTEAVRKGGDEGAESVREAAAITRLVRS